MTRTRLRSLLSVAAAPIALMAWAASAGEPLAAAGPPIAEPLATVTAETVDMQLYDDSVVRDVSLTVTGGDWLTLLGCNRTGATRPGSTPAPRVDVPATLTIDGVTLGDVGVRCKGNSSLGINGTKKPMNIATDSFVAGQDIWGIDVINLNNNWSDPSQLREAIALRLMSEYQPVPRFTFGRVTMNGRYLGLYTLVEQVNGEWADHWYPDDGGTIIKGDSPVRIAFNSSTLNWQGESLDAYKQDYEVKGAAAQADTGYEALRELTRKLDASVANGGLSDAEFADGIRQVLDVESALWYIATSNVLANFDSYYVGKNYYLYLGQRDPRFHVVPWDLGLSFGLFGVQNADRALFEDGDPDQWPAPPEDPGASSARADPFLQSTQRNRPLVRRLLAVPAYRADYVAHYRALLDEVFTREWVGDVGTRYQALVRDAARDEQASQGRISGAFTFDQFVANLTTDLAGLGRPGGGMGGGAPGILAIVDERRAFLAGLEELVPPDLALTSHGHAPTEVTAKDTVVARAAFSGAATVVEVELRYRVDGGFEHIVAATRQPSGAWEAAIPPARPGAFVSYVFRAGLADGRAVFHPSATLTRPFGYRVAGVKLPQQPTGDLVVNEAMASNTSTIADESGKYGDWVEIYNRGTASIDLANYYLSDDRDDPWDYQFPDWLLGPGERLLVWCDNDPDEGPFHAPFRLDADGETIYLATFDAVVETEALPAMLPDQSYMRLPDGSDNWVLCRSGTPNLANACPADGLRTPATPEPTTATPETPEPTTATRTPTRAPTTAVPTPKSTATTPSPVVFNVIFLPFLQGS